jgi:hypothetical protein
MSRSLLRSQGMFLIILHAIWRHKHFMFAIAYRIESACWLASAWSSHLEGTVRSRRAFALILRRGRISLEPVPSAG